MRSMLVAFCLAFAVPALAGEAYPRTYLSEILIRTRADGTVSAHVVYSTVYAPGNETSGLPQPINAANIAGLLGNQIPNLASQVAAAQARISELEGQLQLEQVKSAALKAKLSGQR